MIYGIIVPKRMAPFRKRRPDTDTDIPTAQEGPSGSQKAGDSLQEAQEIMNPKKKKSKYKREMKEDEISTSQSSDATNQDVSATNGKDKEDAKRDAVPASNEASGERLLSGYNIFQMEQRRSISQSGKTISEIYQQEVKSAKKKGVPSDSNKAILKIISARWKQLQPMERVDFELMAKDANERLPKAAQEKDNEQPEMNSSEDFEDMEEDDAEEEEEVHPQQLVPGSISMQHKKAPTAPASARSSNKSDSLKSTIDEEGDQKMPASNNVTSTGCANLGLLSSAASLASAVARREGQGAAESLAHASSQVSGTGDQNQSISISSNASTLLALVNSHLKQGSENKSSQSLSSNAEEQKTRSEQNPGLPSQNRRQNMVFEIVQQLLPHLPMADSPPAASNGIVVPKPSSAVLMTRILQNLLSSPMDDLLHLINILKLISNRQVKQRNPGVVGNTSTNLPSVSDTSSGSDPQVPAPQAHGHPKSDKSALLQQWIQQNYGSTSTRGAKAEIASSLNGLSTNNGLHSASISTTQDTIRNPPECNAISNTSERGQAAMLLQQYLQQQKAQASGNKNVTPAAAASTQNVASGASTNNTPSTALDGLLHQMRQHQQQQQQQQHQQLNTSSQRSDRTQRPQEGQASGENASNPSNAVRDALSKLLASRARSTQPGPIQAADSSNSNLASLPSPPLSSTDILAAMRQQQQPPQYGIGGASQGQNAAETNTSGESSSTNLNLNFSGGGGSSNPGYQAAMQQLLGMLQQRQNNNGNKS